MDTHILRSFRVELEKISARRGLKEIRKMVGSGHADQAAALARKPGVLKPTPHGHQVRDIGKGSEGLATLTAGPEHGLAVRKTYDPKGIASPELIARKEQAGKALKNNPHVAQFHGSTQGTGGTTAHTMEYVQGKEPTVSPQSHVAMNAARKGLAKGMRQAGFAGAADVRPANMIQTPQGHVKAVDYLPSQKGEFATGNQRAQFNKQRTAQGMRPLGKNMQLEGSAGRTPLQESSGSMSPGALKALHFRGVQPVVGGAQPAAVGQQPTKVEGARPMVPTKTTPPMQSKPMMMPQGNMNRTAVLPKV